MTGVPELRSRSRTNSESSEGVDSVTSVASVRDMGLGGMCQVATVKNGTSYDVDGKFTYSQVGICPNIQLILWLHFKAV